MVIVRGVINFIAQFCILFILVYLFLLAPKLFTYEPVVILSDSMEPKIHAGSVVYAMKVKEEDLKEGDIITFKGIDGSYISHRIESIEDGFFITKGDANKEVDSNKIQYSDIIGRDMNIHVPYLGYYVDYVDNHKPLGIIAIAIVVVDFMLGSVLSIGTGANAIKKKKAKISKKDISVKNYNPEINNKPVNNINQQTSDKPSKIDGIKSKFKDIFNKNGNN